MQLYKEEKINPVAAAGRSRCRYPIFFSLYKVIYITIEMRHAPFFGWIRDLSAPDPTSFVNLFGHCRSKRRPCCTSAYGR